MSTKGGKKKGGGPSVQKPGQHQRRLPTIRFEDFADADEVFKKALAGGEFIPTQALANLEKDLDEKPLKGSGERASARKKRGEPTHTIDLHGLRLEEAKGFLDSELAEWLSKTPVTIKIVTGRGVHSGSGGPVLPGEIHAHVSRLYKSQIIWIEESPAELKLGATLLRGHFLVRFGKN